MQHILRAIITGVFAALLLGLAACGRHYKTPIQGAQTVKPHNVTLADALAQLDALAKPDGVDAKLWDELKATLKTSLTTNNDKPTTRFVSSPPTGTANRIQDLTATRETNGDFTLSWHYRNTGDYDQDGTVGVSDLSPLAMHFNETYDVATQPDCIQAVIDGGANGKDDIGDITQIAMYFASETAEYSVQGADQQQGPFSEIYRAQLPADGRGDARLALSLGLGLEPAYAFWRVVPLDGDGNQGEPSDVVNVGEQHLTRVLGVTPLEGQSGAAVTFTAFVTGDGPFTYEWSFGGGATPNTSTNAQPAVTLASTNGAYSAQVKVTGALNSVTYPFTLTVTPAPGNPPVINSVGPFTGLSGDELSFSADVTGDEPLTYEWDFGGGASPPVSADVSPTVILGRGGTLPSPDIAYPCRLTVTNPSGASSADFTLTVSAQWHMEDLPYAPLTNNGRVRSLCFSSDGVLCGVSSYYVTESAQTVVVFGRYVDGQWAMETAATGSYTPNFNGSNLLFTTAGSPVIAWGDNKDNEIHIARRIGDVWEHESIPLGGGFWPIAKLMLDSQDRAVVAYSYFTGDGTKSAFKVAREAGASWDIFDYPQASPLDSVALDQEDKVVVVSNVENELQARLFIETNGGWESHLIIESPEGGIAYPLSLSIDDSGFAHMIVGGAVLGVLVCREKPGFTFEFDAITPPDDGVLYDRFLYLTSQPGEVILYAAINTWELITVSWKSGDIWNYLQAPINGIRPYAHLMTHPSGYIVLENSAQTAAYW